MKKGKSDWGEYELLDCGDLQKLERFGTTVLIRPEPAAIWPARWSIEQWEELAHATCEQVSNNKATWTNLKKFNPNWLISYPLGKRDIRFNLQITSFKHVGIFPEQHVNWNFIYNQVQKKQQAKVLNLFAYTGGASLAAKAAGADVVHVDSIKQVVSWAKKNMESSGLRDIRWVVEDALKFIAREHKRGNLYDGVILDPPAFGLGAKGERWKLESSINTIMKHVASVVNPKSYFVVLNTYSPGFTPLVVENVLHSHFNHAERIYANELFLKSKSGIKMPTGVTGIVLK